MSERKKQPTGEYLDARAFGQLLDLNRESVYRAVERGELQAVRIGRALRIPRSQLDRLLTGSQGRRRISSELHSAESGSGNCIGADEEVW